MPCELDALGTPQPSNTTTNQTEDTNQKPNQKTRTKNQTKNTNQIKIRCIRDVAVIKYDDESNKNAKWCDAEEINWFFLLMFIACVS